MTGEQKQTMRIAGLDGLRAFAVLIVIAAHAHVSWMHGGGLGVDVFFVISGFIITYLLIQEHRDHGRINIGKFWLRRILRLAPALLLMVLLVDLVMIAGHVLGSEHALPTILATPSVLFYYANWSVVLSESAALGWFGPLWSLSVEEQFYLVWPLVVMVVLRAKRSRLKLAFIAAGIALVAAVSRWFTFDGANLTRTFGTDFRVDMLLVGVLLAIALRSGYARAVRAASAVAVYPAVAVLMVFAVVIPEFTAEGNASIQLWYYRLGLPAVALSTAAVIGYLVTHQESVLTRALSIRPLAYTGAISYGLYLWHYPITMALNSVYPEKWDRTPLLIVVLAATYAAAAVSFRFVEKPLQKRFHARLRPTPMAVRQASPVAT